MSSKLFNEEIFNLVSESNIVPIVDLENIICDYAKEFLFIKTNGDMVIYDNEIHKISKNNSKEQEFLLGIESKRDKTIIVCKYFKDLVVELNTFTLPLAGNDLIGLEFRFDDLHDGEYKLPYNIVRVSTNAKGNIDNISCLDYQYMNHFRLYGALTSYHDHECDTKDIHLSIELEKNF